MWRICQKMASKTLLILVFSLKISFFLARQRFLIFNLLKTWKRQKFSKKAKWEGVFRKLSGNDEFVVGPKAVSVQHWVIQLSMPKINLIYFWISQNTFWNACFWCELLIYRFVYSFVLTSNEEFVFFSSRNFPPEKEREIQISKQNFEFLTLIFRLSFNNDEHVWNVTFILNNPYKI